MRCFNAHHFRANKEYFSLLHTIIAALFLFWNPKTIENYALMKTNSIINEINRLCQKFSRKNTLAHIL
jgi:hypothetical protein